MYQLHEKEFEHMHHRIPILMYHQVTPIVLPEHYAIKKGQCVFTDFFILIG